MDTAVCVPLPPVTSGPLSMFFFFLSVKLNPWVVCRFFLGLSEQHLEILSSNSYLCQRGVPQWGGIDIPSTRLGLWACSSVATVFASHAEGPGFNLQQHQNGVVARACGSSIQYVKEGRPLVQDHESPKRKSTIVFLFLMYVCALAACIPAARREHQISL